MATKPRGRPPAGLHGESVSHYPQISMRLPPHTVAVLHALRIVERRSLWRILRDVIKVYARQSGASSWTYRRPRRRPTRRCRRVRSATGLIAPKKKNSRAAPRAGSFAPAAARATRPLRARA